MNEAVLRMPDIDWLAVGSCGLTPAARQTHQYV